MKKIILALAATTALVAAMPAAAQSYGQRDHRGDQRSDQRGAYGQSRQDDLRSYRNRDGRNWRDGTRREWVQARKIDDREEQIADMIDNAVHRRKLTPLEARIFYGKLRGVEDLERRYKRHNHDLSRVEVRTINYRLDLLTKELRYKIRT